jgi:hypothetical protein
MFRLIIFLVVGYFVFKIFRSLLIPKKHDEKVKGKKAETTKNRNIDNKKIEDAEFEELE